MPLSEHEQKMLDAIEREFGATDPKFASTMALKPRPRVFGWFRRPLSRQPRLLQWLATPRAFFALIALAAILAFVLPQMVRL